MTKLLLYCTKEKKQGDLLWSNNLKHFFLDGAYNRLIDDLPEYLLNGKIVAECDFDVEWYDTSWYCSDFIEHNGLEKSCLTKEQLFDYVKGRNEFYAIHINNLNVFDKPKELGQYYSRGQVDWIEETELHRLKNGITIAPQNMCYAYKYSYSKSKLEKYILISIKPQWLCKILNGEKTIEVRKKVLKEMLRNG